jgi:hypothetical protein
MLMKDNNAVFHQALPTTSQFLAQDGDRLKLQLSSAVTMSLDRACNTSADDPTTNHDYMIVLSVKGILPCLFNQPFCSNLHWVLLMEISVSILLLAILMISGHCCFSVVGITTSGHHGVPHWYNSKI